MSNDLPTAKITTPLKGRLSSTWLIPLLAIIITVALFIRWQMNRGPVVTISFQDTSGLTIDSPIMYHGAIVGRVEKITLHTDMSSVVVRVRLDAEASELAREGTSWWIVRPKVSLQGISGLETLIGPRYIEVQLGSGNPTFTFIGSLSGDIPAGKEFTLQSTAADSATAGSPVFYRGIEIGQVTAVQLAEDATRVNFTFIVEDPYIPLIRENTVFWKMGGVSFDAGWLGVNFKAAPLTALLKGGISIATPDRIGNLAEEGFTFIIEEKFNEDWLDWEPTLTLVEEVESK